jgi:hypothetical protein
MKGTATRNAEGGVQSIALALTWDGARWPIRSLPQKARAFLGGSAIPSAQATAELFASDRIQQLRICWVPRLKGGPDVLSESFPTQMRIGFKATKTISFGDILGVVYRRTSR